MLKELGWDVFCKEQLNKTETGKWILCEAREEGSTRLFIHRFNFLASALTKNGWWDTFTVSKKPVIKGYHLARIESFRIDRNGYLNMVVMPLKFLGEEMDEEQSAWRYFFKTNQFSRLYGDPQIFLPLNIENLESAFEDEMKQKSNDLGGSLYRSNFIMDKYLNGEVALDKICELLDEPLPPNEEEVMAKEILHNPNAFADEYPLLIKKLPKDPWLDRPTIETVESYLIRKGYEYTALIGNC